MIISLINTMYQDNFINRNDSDLAPCVCSEHVQGTEIKVIHAEIYASNICGCTLKHYVKDWRH